MTGQFFEDFQSSSINFATTPLRISVIEFFTFHSPYLAIIRKKGPLRLSYLKIVTEKRYRKILRVVNL